MKPTARETHDSARKLLDFILPWYEKGSAAHILAARVERVLALPWSEDSEGYNEGLAKVRRILDGEEE